LSRFAATALVLCLLGGTAVALGIIEGFKLEKNPISGPYISHSFSPVCKCSQDVARITASGNAIATGIARIIIALFSSTRVNSESWSRWL